MIKSYLPVFIFEESPVLNAVIESIQEEFENFSRYRDEKILGWYLETASGEELDRIGKLVGEPRKGNDVEYRAAILTRVTSLVGTHDVLLDTAIRLSDETAQVEDMSPGVVKLSINAERFGDIPQEVFVKGISRVKAAGIHVHFNWRIFESTVDELKPAEEAGRKLPLRNADDLVPEENAGRKTPFSLETSLTYTENIEVPVSDIGAFVSAGDELAYTETLKFGADVANADVLEYTEELLNSLHPLPWTWGEAVADFCEWCEDTY